MKAQCILALTLASIWYSYCEENHDGESWHSSRVNEYIRNELNKVVNHKLYKLKNSSPKQKVDTVNSKIGKLYALWGVSTKGFFKPITKYIVNCKQ